MASATDFKQKCPKCGGVLTIVNPALIGKKIACPKCHTRFTVEGPGADDAPPAKKPVKAAAAAAAAVAAKNGPAKAKAQAKGAAADTGNGAKPSLKKKKKAKEGMKGTMILAIVGVVVFIGAAIGVYFAFFNDGDSKTSTTGGPPPNVRPPTPLGGGGNPPPPELVGKWKLPSGKVTIEFTADGKLIAQDGDTTVDGTFSVNAQRELVGQLSQPVGPNNLEKLNGSLSFEGNKASVTSPTGEFVELVKVSTDYGPGPGGSPLDPKTEAERIANDPSNLLPNNTQVLLYVPVKKFIDSPIGSAIFNTRGAFRISDFYERLGIPMEKIEQLIMAGNKDSNQAFVVIRTEDAYEWDKVREVLQAQPAPQKVKGQEYYLGKVDFLTEFVEDRIPIGGLRQKAAILRRDGRTLIYGDEKTILAFLETPPTYKTKPPTESGGGGGFPGGGFPMPPGAGGGFPMPPGAPGAGGAGAPPGAGAGTPPPGGDDGFGASVGDIPGRDDQFNAQAPGAGAGTPPPGGAGVGAGTPPPDDGGGTPGFPGFPGFPGGATSSSGAKDYLTINTDLRKLVIAAKTEKQPLILYAADTIKQTQSPAASIPYFDKLNIGQQRDIRVVAIALHQDENLTLTVAALCKNKSAGSVSAKIESILAEAAKNELKDMFGFEFEVKGSQSANANPGFPGFPMPPGGGGGGAAPPPIPPGGAGGFAPPMPPGGGGGGGAAPPPIPPAPGGAGGFAPPRPPGGGGGGFPGFPGFPGSDDDQQKRDEGSTITISQDGEILKVLVKIIDRRDAKETVVDSKLAPEFIRIRGTMDMNSQRFRFPELAGPWGQLRDDPMRNGILPWGALPREQRGARPWPADQRVSWIRDMLPYMQDDRYRDLHASLDPTKSWRDPDNVAVGRVLIPQLLHPQSGRFYTKVRGIDGQMAVTHFVGMAGVGPDAPYYSKDDPRAGIFGFNRQTRLADIKDGTSTTIFMIQTDPTTAGAWIAGGGATIRGISESGENDIGVPGRFRSPLFNGKPGAFVMMADGTVRFISKDISPEVLKALCTINGSEPISNLEGDAPRVGVAPPTAPPKAEAPMRPIEGPKPPATAVDGELGAEIEFGPIKVRAPKGYKQEEQKANEEFTLKSATRGDGSDHMLYFQITKREESLDQLLKTQQEESAKRKKAGHAVVEPVKVKVAGFDGLRYAVGIEAEPGKVLWSDWYQLEAGQYLVNFLSHDYAPHNKQTSKLGEKVLGTLKVK